MNINLTDELITYFQSMYWSNDGYVKILGKANDETTHRSNLFMPAKDLTDKNSIESMLAPLNGNNLYMSLGCYKTTQNGAKANLLNVCALGVDCDFRSIAGQEDVNIKDVIELLNLLWDSGYLPRPTYIEYSRNIRLIYILENPYKLTKSKKRSDCFKFLDRVTLMLCKRVNSYNSDAWFYGQTFQFNAEPHRLTSYVRVPGSFNKRTEGYYDPITKTYVVQSCNVYQVAVEQIGSLWNIGKLADYVLPDKFEGYDEWKAKKQKKKDTVKIYNISQLCQKRLEDLSYLQKSGYDVGHREKMCYLYYLFSVQSGLSKEKALANTLSFNDGFIHPLPSKEVKSKCRPSDFQQKFTNAYLRDFLGCEKLPVFISSGVSNAERCRAYYRKMNPISKKEQIEEKVTLVKAYRAEGKTYKEIATILGISERTAKNYAAKSAA